MRDSPHSGAYDFLRPFLNLSRRQSLPSARVSRLATREFDILYARRDPIWLLDTVGTDLPDGSWLTGVLIEGRLRTVCVSEQRFGGQLTNRYYGIAQGQPSPEKTRQALTGLVAEITIAHFQAVAHMAGKNPKNAKRLRHRHGQRAKREGRNRYALDFVMESFSDYPEALESAKPFRDAVDKINELL